MIRRPPRSTLDRSSAASDVYKRQSEVLSARYVLEYTYQRSVGPVIGRFLAGLADKRIEGARTKSGRVIVPPTEYDPDNGEAISELVPVAETGVISAWCW